MNPANEFLALFPLYYMSRNLNEFSVTHWKAIGSRNGLRYGTILIKDLYAALTNWSLRIVARDCVDHNALTQKTPEGQEIIKKKA